MGSAASKICAAVFYRPVLIKSGWSFAGPKHAEQGGIAMDDREELRRLIDVIEKGSGSGSLEQAVDDIKTFANTVSFLANKLDARIKGGNVKTKPKSRMGKAIATAPKPAASTVPSSPTEPASAHTSGMPMATSIATSQADFERLKPQGSQPPVGAS